MSFFLLLSVLFFAILVHFIVACICQETLRRSFRAVGKVVHTAGRLRDETDVSQHKFFKHL